MPKASPTGNFDWIDGLIG
jgi:hypothetical protein